MSCILYVYFLNSKKSIFHFDWSRWSNWRRTNAHQRLLSGGDFEIWCVRGTVGIHNPPISIIDINIKLLNITNDNTHDTWAKYDLPLSFFGWHLEIVVAVIYQNNRPTCHQLATIQLWTDTWTAPYGDRVTNHRRQCKAQHNKKDYAEFQFSLSTSFYIIAYILF